MGPMLHGNSASRRTRGKEGGPRREPQGARPNEAAGDGGDGGQRHSQRGHAGEGDPQRRGQRRRSGDDGPQVVGTSRYRVVEPPPGTVADAMALYFLTVTDTFAVEIVDGTATSTVISVPPLPSGAVIACTSTSFMYLAWN